MNRRLIAVLAVLVFFSVTDFGVAADDIKSVASDDPEMVAAIKKARETLPMFFNALAHPKPSQKSFLLKVVFRQRAEVEHIGLPDLVLSGKKANGVVADEPGTRGLRFMQRVSFDPADITDWMFIEDGKLVGGYTTRLLRERMSAEERKELDASAPYKF